MPRSVCVVQDSETCLNRPRKISVVDVDGQSVGRDGVVLVALSEYLQRVHKEILTRELAALCLAKSVLEVRTMVVVTEAHTIET